MIQTVFNRVEKKYLLNKKQAEELIKIISKYIKSGEYPYSKICNIYFDTQNSDLIRKSIEKPVYKEKIRLRSYGIPNKEDRVFLEIKKKFDGVVTKRRIALKLEEVYEYLENNKKPEVNKQIFNEIDYCFKKYNLKPSMYISYERYSYMGKEDENFRLTFDTNIISRESDLNLDKGDYGINVIGKDVFLMEVKCLESMPLWLTNALSVLKIYPVSFSKYGRIYENKLLKIS
jgi:SPX domain protein involved in polyphosphate accumulation